MGEEWFNYLGPQDREEMRWLVQILEKLSPHSILEIGVQEGSSLKFWELLLSPGDLLIGIDNDPRFPDLVRWQWKNSDRNIVLINGDSTDDKVVARVEKVLNGRTIDFLFIDGNHEYEYVKSDFLNYSRFVRSRGLVVFHDIGCPGPYQVFSEIREGTKESIHLRHESHPGYGYGVWWKCDKG